MRYPEAADLGRGYLAFYAFDVLHLDGYDLRDTPLAHRKRLLEEILVPLDRVRRVECFPEAGEACYRAAVEHGFEGIVAKHCESRYEEGKRTKRWLKVKRTRSAEFVVGGYAEGRGNRDGTAGALIVGAYDTVGQLRYAAHVGSGLDRRVLSELRQRFEGMLVQDSPFVDRVPTHGRSVWVQPALVAEVKFAEWTPDGYLRAPVFIRLREDKPPGDAVLPEGRAPRRSDAARQARLPLP